MSVRDNIVKGTYKNTVPFTKETRQAHSYNEAVLMARFKEDLAREHGLDTHPKATKLWDIAWSMGHASGLSEVETYYAEFAELLK